MHNVNIKFECCQAKPQTNNRNTNRHTLEEDVDKTIVTNNCLSHKTKKACIEHINDAKTTQHIIQCNGMLDLNSTGNFIDLNANVKNKQPTNNSLNHDS